jgi:hypothetical protein
MVNLFKSKLISLFIVLFRTSPFFVLASMFFKGLFLLTQVVSLMLIIGWAMGSVRAVIVEVIGVPPESVLFPCIGAAGFVLSTLFSLFSKQCALKATSAFETHILGKFDPNDHSLSSGDLNSIVKLMISIVDSVVPIVLILGVSVAWAVVKPYSVLIILILMSLMFWIIKKGIRFSSKRFRLKMIRPDIKDYVESDQHERFYGILLTSHYISIGMTIIISISLVISLVTAKEFLDFNSGYAARLLLVTGVAFLQARSFVGIIMRTGAYNKSLVTVHNIMSSR